MMKKNMLFSLFLAATWLMAGTPVKLRPAQTGDLASDQLVRGGLVTKGPAVTSESVAVSWSLAEETTLDLNPQPHVAESKSFWLEVTAADFNEGIELTLTRPGALVRISPVVGPGSQSGIDPMDVVLISPKGESFSGGSGMDLLVSPEQMEAADRNLFPASTSVFRVGAALGSGEMLLYADGLDYGSKTRYVVQVQESDSEVALRIHTGQDTYLEGQHLWVNAELTANGNISVEKASGRLVSPSGRTFPLSFQPGTGRASLPLKGMADATPGLWQVEITAFGRLNGALVRRDARTAFAYGLPTARFSGNAEVHLSKAALDAEIALEVGLPGRYEVRGVLFGADEKGQLRPVAIGQSAASLQAGPASLLLSFDQKIIEEAGVNAPFEVRDLRLIHQDRLSLIQRLRDGFRFQP